MLVTVINRHAPEDGVSEISSVDKDFGGGAVCCLCRVGPMAIWEKTHLKDLNNYQTSNKFIGIRKLLFGS